MILEEHAAAARNSRNRGRWEKFQIIGDDDEVDDLMSIHPKRLDTRGDT
jgi:hypothetical protein